MIWEDACRTLGIAETATPAEIKEQYLYKVQLLHPDKTLDKPDKVRQKAEEELAHINEAYKFLSDDKNNPRTPPKLEITPAAVRFTEVVLNQGKTTDIELKSVGGPFTNCWIDNSPAPWLVVTGVRATTSEALPLMVTIEAQGIPAVTRPERCSILVRLKNEKTGLVDESAVVVEIEPLPLVAKLKIKKGKIRFQDVPVGVVRSCVLDIGNGGPDVLHGYIASSSPWLSASQSEIVLPRRTVSRCTLNVDTENLPAGFREVGFIKVCTNGGEVAIAVELMVDRRGQGRPVSAGYGSNGSGAKSYGGMQTMAPVAPSKRKGGGSWLIKFIALFVVTFGVGLVCILLFTGSGADGPDVGSIWGWGAITFAVSLLIAMVSG